MEYSNNKPTPRRSERRKAQKAKKTGRQTEMELEFQDLDSQSNATSFITIEKQKP